MTAAQDYEFTGWGAFGKDCVEKGNFKQFTYEPKKWDEEDVDIKIQYCGVCGSDLHTASGGWGDVDYPQVVGHEIVGIAVRVGSKVTHVKEGDLVGVGAQSDSCRECRQCKKAREPYCEEGQVGTYGSKFKRGAGKGDKSFGGYADYHRAPGHFVLKIPDGLDPALAAPMLCAGGTLYSPLKQYGAGTEDVKNVGIIGIGGLGHFGLLFAKALGAEVTAISHSDSKKDAALKLGASHFIATGDDPAKALEPHAKSLDLLIASSNDPHMPLNEYLSLLRAGGHLIAVGLPEKPLPQIQPFSLVANNVHLGGSCICSPEQLAEMLQLAHDQKIHPWIEKRPMTTEGVNEAVQDMENGKARFRYVLVNEKNGGKL